MDIYINQKGRLSPAPDGELPVVVSLEDKKQMYFSAAILRVLDNSDLKELSRVTDAIDPASEEVISQRLRETVVNAVIGSPFGNEFDPAQIQVTPIYESGTDFSIKVEYGNRGSGSTVNGQFQIQGGTLLVDDTEDVAAYLDNFQAVVMTEEIIVQENTNFIALSFEATNFVIVSDSGTVNQTGTFKGNLSDFPPVDRYTVRQRVVYSEEETVLITRGRVDDATDYNSPVDEIFFRTLVPELTSKDYITLIQDVKGNISRIEYVAEADDYVLVFDTSDGEIDIIYSYMDHIAKGQETVIGNQDEMPFSNEPFPNDSFKGPRLVFLDRALEPGVYVVTYLALIKDGSNASLI